MIKKYKYLNDPDFLYDFDQLQLKEQFVKITVLTFAEKPIREIQGHVSGGNVSVDGNSSVRRTANITFVAEDTVNDLTDINHILSLNKKVKMEVGFTNTTFQYQEYPILWFPLGIYVIVSASLSNSSGGVTISLQLKDKMCLLNGECGGIIPASTTFHEYDTVDEKGETVTLQPTIYQIIQEVVNHFGGEQLGKIIISGLDTRVKKVMKWTGSSPIYVINSKTDGASPQYVLHPEEDVVDKIEIGDQQDVGYIYTNFTYDSELVVDAGAPVTEVLDKIKEELGNFEYFYDLEGNFVFQEVQNFLNTSQSTAIIQQLEQSAQPYIIDISKGKTVYKFSNDNIITSYSNSPQYNMIKNDFVVWGVRKNSDGKEFPIRYHLAIDDKPEIENLYFTLYYKDPADEIYKVAVPIPYPSKDSFPERGLSSVYYCCPETSTNSNKKVLKVYFWDGQNYQEVKEDKDQEQYLYCFMRTSDWRTELYLQGASAEPYGVDSNYYYTELKNEWTKLYNLLAQEIDIREYKYESELRDFVSSTFDINLEDLENIPPVFSGQFKESTTQKPTTLDFFLDFISVGATLSNISVNNIGRRTKVVNDNKVNCIFETDVPDFILIEKSRDNTAELRKECLSKGQPYVQVDTQIYEALGQGGYLNSAYVAIQDLLYQHTGYNETINISCLPIYYLEPNTRIYVEDDGTGIKGDYIISSFNLPLDTNSTMSISATRALDRI